MRFIFTFTIAVLILTACSQAVPSATSTPLPSLTPTQTQMPTATPPPTFTPLPPLAPEILAAAQEIFGKDLKVNLDGSVFDPATNQIIPGFTIKPTEDGKSWEWQRVDGELTLSGGQDDIRLFGNGGLGMDGWRYENGEWVKVEIKEYPINKEPLKFKECYIPPEAILDKSFTEYLKTLDWPVFDEAKLKFQELSKRTMNNEGAQIAYIGKTAPNYPTEETRPYQRPVFCYTKFSETVYAVVPTRYYVEGIDPKQYPWVPGLIYLGPESYYNTPEGMANAELAMTMYMEDMNYPIYDTTNFIYPDKSTGLPPLPDPLPTAVFENYPDIQVRIDAFIAGDPMALDGVPLSVEVYSLGKYNK